MSRTMFVSKVAVIKRLNALMKAADQAAADSALAILHDWSRRKAGEAVTRHVRVEKDESGNHFISIVVLSLDSAPIEELTRVATDIVNQEGLPKWMVQAGRRIEVRCTETPPGTDSECWQLHGA